MIPTAAEMPKASTSDHPVMTVCIAVSRETTRGVITPNKTPINPPPIDSTIVSIRNWVVQWERNAGRGDGGLTTAEREELSRLRRENRQLRLERETLSKAAAWFARETNAIPPKGSGS